MKFIDEILKLLKSQVADVHNQDFECTSTGQPVTSPRLSRYNWMQLNDQEKMIYDTILDALYRFDKDVKVETEHKVNIDQIMRVYTAVRYDNPLIFWAEPNKLTANIYSDMAIIELRYTYPRSEIGELQNKIESTIQCIAVECRLNEGSDYERSLRLYEYMTSHVIYSEEDFYDAHNIIGPILRGKSVCEGSAMAMNLILNRYGINCNTISGSIEDSVNDNHAWNIVRLDKHYYHQDVTQDLKNNTHVYFNLNDSEMSKTHRYKHVLNCSSMELNYYVVTNTLLTLREAEKYILSAMQARRSRIEVKISESVDISYFKTIASKAVLPVPQYSIETVQGTGTFLFTRM